MTVESIYETWSKYVMGGSRWALVKEMGQIFLDEILTKRVIYLLRKPWILAVEKTFEIGRKNDMESIRWVLVKMVLFS